MKGALGATLIAATTILATGCSHSDKLVPVAWMGDREEGVISNAIAHSGIQETAQCTGGCEVLVPESQYTKARDIALAVAATNHLRITVAGLTPSSAPQVLGRG